MIRSELMAVHAIERMGDRVLPNRHEKHIPQRFPCLCRTADRENSHME